MKEPNIGDYVVATKYKDGDPKDHFCVGFITGYTSHDEPRFLVCDDAGQQFRASGFRRAEKICPTIGDMFVQKFNEIEHGGKSIWSIVKTARRQMK